jgi:hypothetical protein
MGGHVALGRGGKDQFGEWRFDRARLLGVFAHLLALSVFLRRHWIPTGRMLAESMILTGDCSPLSYLLTPLTDCLSRAARESD